MEPDEIYYLLIDIKEQYGFTYEVVMTLFLDSKIYLKNYDDIKRVEFEFNKYLKTIDLENINSIYLFEGELDLTDKLNNLYEQLIEMISEKRNMNKIQATVFFFNSSFYKELSDLDTMLWIRGINQIYDVFFGTNKVKYIKSYVKK